MYGGAFCRIYNAFGWNAYPQVFGEQLLEWLRRKGVAAKRCLDLGCGTGVLCETLAAAGMETLGVDLSEGMIAVARQRAPQLRYAVADMTAYRPAERFDLVTCTGDALNHIFNMNDVARIFQNVFACLNAGGWFVFDLLNEGEVPSGEPFDLDYDEHIRARFLTQLTGCEVMLNISVFEDDVLKLEEHIREKIHDPAAVCGLLRQAGFRVEQCADQLLLGGDAHGTTWFIAARKPAESSDDILKRD